MLIPEATRKYLDACSANNGQPPFEDLVGTLIESGYSQNFSNDSYFDALWLTHHMLNRSSKGICVLTGSAGDGFYATLKGPFEAALERIRNTKGQVRMVILNQKGNVPAFLEEMRKKFDGVFHYVLGQTTSAINHFVVCDSRMVRVEDIHADVDENSLATAIRAKVNFNDPMLASLKEKFFNAVWQQLAGPSLKVAEDGSCANLVAETG